MLLVSSAIQFAIHRKPQIYHSAFDVCVCIRVHQQKKEKEKPVYKKALFYRKKGQNRNGVFICVCVDQVVCVFSSL